MNERIVDELVLKAREIAISDTKDDGTVCVDIGIGGCLERTN